MAQNIYVINGFYMAMREKYTKPSASITYFVVEWDSASLSWSDFRGKVLGATDPTTAEVGSLRRIILEQYKELGLQSIPNVGDNGVHASASPFEGLAERLNWVGAKLETDPFGKALLELGIHPSTILEWTKDPQVEYQGKKGSLFDLLEDKNSNEVLEIAKGVASVSGSSSPTKNIAFVFVKPHAQTPAVASLVKEKFAQSGISVLLEGTLDGQTIESNLLIDNHYYAIANKASLTKPKDLNPPATKQAEFEQTFGLTWAEALNRGIVFNAVDACKVLGVDGEQMDSIWGKAKKDGKLVKFGGGFYCGQLPGPQPKPSNQNLYVINGFYMAMREKYTKPGASISYFLAEWDPAVLSWADFRGRVLGATDPTTAVEGSLRRIILEQYKELGLTSQPNVGDNGVHASASPFEGLAERLNWVGAKLETDPFGQALLAAGISPATILEWTKDPQVEFEGKKGSLFDLMEDLNSGDVLEKAKVVAKSSGSVGPAKNAAFIFVKPHAVTPAVVSLVRSKLVENGLTITQEGSLDSQVIEANLLIDNHYYAIANKASLTKPKDLNPPTSKQEDFAKTFGLTWTEALQKNLVFNAVDACHILGIDGETMDNVWATAKKAGKLVKFGGGFYCGEIPSVCNSKPSEIFTINGFYMAMRDTYTKPGASISYFVAEWEPAVLSWADFRGRVLGATDPTTAVEGSLRRIILEQYKELGLTSQPNVGDNGVHASASPFEGLAERLNWVGAKLETDPFGQALLAAGISPATILEWTKDPQVEFEGKKGSLFDLMEDLNSGDVLEKAKVVAKSSGSVGPAKNAAFIFVKPHAVTPAVVSLVRSKLVENGLTITQEGSLDSQVIEANLLIDNHYYAIANKASLTKPKDLNPPASKQEEFAKTFGITWAEALAKGLVFNAVDACKLLGVNGDQMDDIWAKAKKANQLVKFGGGFYCGRLQL